MGSTPTTHPIRKIPIAQRSGFFVVKRMLRWRMRKVAPASESVCRTSSAHDVFRPRETLRIPFRNGQSGDFSLGDNGFPLCGDAPSALKLPPIEATYYMCQPPPSAPEGRVQRGLVTLRVLMTRGDIPRVHRTIPPFTAPYQQPAATRTHPREGGAPPALRASVRQRLSARTPSRRQPPIGVDSGREAGAHRGVESPERRP